jgi:hypothetical protein
MIIRYLISAVVFCLLSLSPLWGQTVSKYGQADAVVMEAYPDSIIDQSNVGSNILAYKHREGENLYAVYSYVSFDISNLNGTQVENSSFSYRGKTGDADFEELFEIELHSLKSDFDADNLTWNDKPQKDKLLATSALNSSSARKAFINDGSKFTDYINEATRKGETTIGFLIRSTAKDSTSNMWIGGIGNGNFGPILEYTISPEKSGYAHSDAVAMQTFPDSIIDQSNLGGNILAYRHDVDGELNRVESYVKYDISHLVGQQVETVSLSYRGKTGNAEFEDLFEIEAHSLKSDFDADNLTWSNKPQKDKKLASSVLNASSARKTFINEGTRFADYINEELRKGNTTVGLLIRSAAKDSTSNMWIGGAENGSFGPILDYTIAPKGSQYAMADAVILQMHPDSTLDQSQVGGNILAYRESVDGELMRVQSYVTYDLSALQGKQVENVSFSYRGKTGAADFEELFELEAFSVKAGYDAGTINWNNKPQRDKKLAGSALNSSSARKAFINEGTRFQDYINEEIRKGATELHIMVRSTAKDSTSNMWIGGAENGTFGPILEFDTKSMGSAYGTGDAVVLQMHPDSTLDQSQVGGNILAYRESVDGELMRVQSYVKYDLSGLNGEQIEAASFSYRGKTGAADFEEEFELQLQSVKADFDPEAVTWNNRPSKDKVLATSLLNSSSARKDFVNTDSRLVEYINEEIRKGATTVSFLVRSAAKDSTSNMWIGGIENGNFGPVLDISRPNLFRLENDTLTVIEDVFVSEAEGDMNFEIADADMHVINAASTNESKNIYLKFNISASKNGIGTATLMLRGDQNDPPSQDENFWIEIYGTDSDDWSEGALTWNTTPSVTTDALAEYNITESGMHLVQGSALTAYVNDAIKAGRENLTFVVRGRDETAFRGWISSKNWVPAQLALDYSTQDKRIIEDSYVAEGTPDENYDGTTAMQIAMDDDANNDRETLLKFDLDGSRSNIVTATLIVKGDQENTGVPLDNFYIEVYGTTDNSWDETTVTWTTKPDNVTGPLMEFNITESADHELTSPDLTNFVKTAISQEQEYISFVIRGRDNTPGSNAWISDQGWKPARLFLDYRQIVASPAIITPAGDYIPEVTVEVVPQTPGSTIYYTLDGTVPTEESLLYEAGILLTDTATVTARAFADGLLASSPVSATYNVAAVGLPVFSPTPLVEYNDAVNVTIDIQPQNAFVFYSDDSSDPLTPYPGGGILLTETTTLRARGVNADGSVFGPVLEATYTVVNTVPGTGTGPGGVGASDNAIAGQPENALWLRADAITDVADGEQVFTWTDQSGNGNDAYNTFVEGGDNGIPNTGESQKPAPTYIADGLNGKPVMQFGLDDGSAPLNRSLIIDDADNLDGGAGISIFTVFKRNQFYADFAAMFQKRDISSGAAAQAYVLEFNGGANPHTMQFVIERSLFLRSDSEFNDQDYYIVNAELQGDFAQAILRSNGGIEKLNSFNGIVPAVDAPVIIGGFQPISIPELVVYKKGLNAAQNLIVHNYLAVKYGLNIMEDDTDLKLYTNTDYTEDLIGVGKTIYIDGTTEQEHRSASGAGMQIDVRSPFAVDEFVMAAHNGLPVNSPSDWERVWNVEVIGNSPNVDLIFDFEAAGVDAPGSVDNLKLLYHDGEEWTDTGLAPVAGDGTVKFAVDGLQSGQYRLGTLTNTREVDHSDLLRVFPNPSNGDAINIRLDNDAQGTILIGVYDYTGREVRAIRTDKAGTVLQETLNLNSLPNGMYTVRVLQEGHFQAIRKLIKQ